MKNHEHEFRVSTWTGHPDGPHPFTISFRCTQALCEKRVERVGTYEEFKKLEVKWDEEPNEHTVWHEFAKEFKQEGTGQYEFIGYELICRVEEWAEKHPNYVAVTRCDDASFSGSRIVLIENRTDERFMGVTLVCIPQNDAGNGTCVPTEMFLYPHHIKDLVNAFSKKITRHYNKIRKIEVVKEEEHRKVIDSIKFEQEN